MDFLRKTALNRISSTCSPSKLKDVLPVATLAMSWPNASCAPPSHTTRPTSRPEGVTALTSRGPSPKLVQRTSTLIGLPYRKKPYAKPPPDWCPLVVPPRT